MGERRTFNRRLEMERLDLEGDEILRDTFDPFFAFQAISGRSLSVRNGMWRIIRDYRVVYCTFYVRRIISSSLRGRRREYCVVKRIIIKTIGYDNLEYLEIFSNKGKKERKTFEIGQFNSNSLKSLILSSKLSFVYYNYDYNYS